MARAITKVLIVDEHNHVVTISESPLGDEAIETMSVIKYKQKKAARNVSGDIEYFGKNISSSAETTATDWVITKYYYDISGDYESQKTKVSSWDDRAAGW